MIFSTEYVFKGDHAEKVKALSSFKFDKEHTFFERNMDVYLLAPIVGFLYNRRSPVDKGTFTTKIFADILLKYQKELEFNYRLVMLLDEEYESNFENRVNKAFRDYGSDKAKVDMERFDEYVRGGVDVLHEKLLQNATMPDQYIKNLYEFMKDFESRYNQSSDEIIDLCKLARS